MTEELVSTPAAASKRPPQFAASNAFVVPLQSGEDKRFKVRFPSDEEWCERARKQRSIRRSLGRGKYKTEAAGIDAVSLELFERIRLEGPELTEPSDASAVIGKLELAEVRDCEREGNNFRVVVRVPGARTEHVVKMPTRKQMDRYEEASFDVVNVRRAQEIRAFLEPSGELYDTIVLSERTKGYAGPVPIVHKAAVIGEVMAQMAVGDEEAVPEE